MHCGRKGYIHIEEEVETSLEKFYMDPEYYIAVEWIVHALGWEHREACGEKMGPHEEDPKIQSINKAFLLEVICNTESYMESL